MTFSPFTTATLAALCLLSVPASAATYQFTGANYVAPSIANFTPPCSLGVCANYTTAMRVTGQFFTAAPLAANLANADIYPQVTSFQFSDGVNTYQSAAPGVRPSRFQVTTNALGEVTGSDIIIGAWQDNLAGPHAMGNRHNVVSVTSFAGVVGNNNVCTGVVAGSLVPDTCVADSDGNSSAVTGVGGSWTTLATPAASVPTLSEWALLLLAGLVGVAACTGARPARRKR